MENKCNMVSRMRSWDIKKILSKNEGNLHKVSALANNIYVGSFIVTNMDNKMSILRDKVFKDLCQLHCQLRDL